MVCDVFHSPIPVDQTLRPLQNAHYLAAIFEFETGVIVDVNRVFLEICGNARDEIIGKTVFDLGLFSDPSDGAKLLRELNKSNFITAYRCLLQNKHGKRFEVLATLHVMEWSGKKYIFSVSSDITGFNDRNLHLKKK